MVTLRDVLIPSIPTTANIFMTTCTVVIFEMEGWLCRCLSQRVEESDERESAGGIAAHSGVGSPPTWAVKNFRRIPVVDKRLVGMVSVGDINRGLFSSVTCGGAVPDCRTIRTVKAGLQGRQRAARRMAFLLVRFCLQRLPPSLADNKVPLPGGVLPSRHHLQALLTELQRTRWTQQGS